MNPEPAKPNDDWYHDDCPTCRQLKAAGIVMQAHDDDEPEGVSVTITYSLALQAITGKAMERGGTISMLVNDEPPTEDYGMRSGDTLTLQILRPEYWDSYRARKPDYEKTNQ